MAEMLRKGAVGSRGKSVFRCSQISLSSSQKTDSGERRTRISSRFETRSSARLWDLSMRLIVEFVRS